MHHPADIENARRALADGCLVTVLRREGLRAVGIEGGGYFPGDYSMTPFPEIPFDVAISEADADELVRLGAVDRRD